MLGDNLDLKKRDPSELSLTPVHHLEAHHDDFHQALSGAMETSPKVKEFVHLYEPHEYSKMKTFLAPDKKSGYAVKNDGDIVSVFSTEKGRGDHIMQHALKNGGHKLDAFDGALPQIYAKHGFKEYKREKNWTPGKPDIVYMHKPNNKESKIHDLLASEDYLMAKAEDKSTFYKSINTLDKSSYGPKSMNLYSADDNARRKMGRTSETIDTIGPNKAVHVTAPTHKDQANQIAREATLKSKKNPVKVYTLAEKRAFAKKAGLKATPKRKLTKLAASEIIKSENEQPMETTTFMAYDGDNAGRLVGRAILADDAQALHDVSNRISHGHDIVKDWVEAHGGKVISGGGDEGTFIIPQHCIEDIEKLRSDYKFATNLTMTVGVGHSLSQSGKALMVGKFRGKDQVCQYDASIEEELTQSQAHLVDGTATEEEQKINEAYFKPEGTPMKESEDAHADCQYCAEMQQDNVQDEDHCQYCHDIPSEDEAQPHCEYCAMADQANAYDHDHNEENCEYCAAADQSQDHEHSGDDCEYCAAANNESGDDMESIAQEVENSPEQNDQPTDVMSEMDNHNGPSDMALAEDEVPEAAPDLSEVLQTGLDQHSDNIQKERVVQMVSEALEGFKACKNILERAQQQAPQLYESSLAMLKAMIEMAKMLGLAPQEEQPQESSPQNPQSFPQQDQAEQQPEEQAAGKTMGR